MVADDDGFKEFLACWDKLPRRTHPFLPSKGDINPVTFGSLIQNTGLAEYQGKMNMHVFFYPTALEQQSGLKITGQNYYDLIDENFKIPLNRFHRHILETPCGAFIADVVTTRSGSSYLYETYQYPVADENGHVRYLLVYGLGRRPFEDTTGRQLGNHVASNIKEMVYIDLGAGAPSERIEDFRFYK